jgi:hypothetical protein
MVYAHGVVILVLSFLVWSWLQFLPTFRSCFDFSIMSLMWLILLKRIVQINTPLLFYFISVNHFVWPLVNEGCEWIDVEALHHM